MSLKLSVVEISTRIRAGRSARAQITPESTDTSPDCTPCVTSGRSAARLIDGLAIPPTAASVASDAPEAISRRRSGRDESEWPFCSP